VILVGQSAAYSPTGDWFAFTARPSDGSAGPDIYVWHVGDATARPATTDHHSVFGSWVGDLVAGSTVEASGADASSASPDRTGTSFLLDPATGQVTPMRQTGRAWRPSVDPTGQRAVYWAGTLRTAPDAPVDLPDAGRLVVGDWGSGSAQPSEGPVATPPTGDQGEARHETTIAAGRIADWDARWDSAGAKLAVWIADDDNPEVGSLSLYNVDLFSGRVDLKKPLLDHTRSTAGFSMSDGKLVWADPTVDASSTGGRVLMLAWTADGEGTVETLSGKVVVIR